MKSANAFCAFTLCPASAGTDEGRDWWSAAREQPDPELAVALVDRAIPLIAADDEERRAVASSYLRRATQAPMDDDELADAARRKKIAHAWAGWWKKNRSAFQPRRNVWP